MMMGSNDGEGGSLPSPGAHPAIEHTYSGIIFFLAMGYLLLSAVIPQIPETVDELFREAMEIEAKSERSKAEQALIQVDQR